MPVWRTGTNIYTIFGGTGQQFSGIANTVGAQFGFVDTSRWPSDQRWPAPSMGADAEVFEGAAPPDPPTEASVMSGVAGDTTNELSWTAPDRAAAFDLYRGVAGATPTLFEADLAGLTYLDTGLTNGTEYAYYVIAKNAGGSAPQSNTVLLSPALAPLATRTARPRVFRSTQTSPNAGTVRDLAASFGVAANTGTTAAFGVGSVGFLLRPGAATSTTASPPTAPSTAVAGEGWRDTVAEHATEQVRYSAGTWTIRARLNKTVMTVNATVTVRLTLVVYRVTAAGVFISELGRVVMADQALPTVGAVVTLSGSFTAPLTTLAADDKLQVEAYVENIIAGIPAATVSPYTVAFVVDETDANSGAGFTAQPAYALLYGRGLAEAIALTDALGRQISYARDIAESIPLSESVARLVGVNRSMAESIPLTESVVRAMAYRRSSTEAIPTTDVATRAAAYARAMSEAIPTSDVMARRAGYGRGLAETLPTSDALARIVGVKRGLAESIALTEVLARATASNRSLSESIPLGESLARRVDAVRALSESMPLTDAMVRRVAANRMFTEAIPTTDALARTASFVRALAESIPLADVVARSMGYSRGLTEDLAVGGGGQGPVTEAEIEAIATAAANKVWDELTAEARAAGSYGALVVARLDAAVSSRATAASVVALGTPAQDADLAIVHAFVDELEGRLTAARAVLLDNLDVTVSTRATGAAVAALGDPAQASALAIVEGLVDDLEARLTAARALLLDNLDVPVSSVSGGGGGAASQGGVLV